MRIDTGRSFWIAPLYVALLIAGCGQWHRVGTGSDPDPNLVVPRLFDSETTYRGMGLLASGQPLPFVASLGFVAGPTADSTFALFGLSLTNNALVFRKSGDHYQARYSVEVSILDNGASVAHVSEEETIRVGEFSETQRHDESVIFQHVVTLPPGELSVTVVVRDQKGRSSGRAEGTISVPRYGSELSVSSLIPVYRSLPRTHRAEIPSLVLNPRATMPFRSDTLYLYFEAYGAGAEASVAIRALDRAQNVVWRGEQVVKSQGKFGVAEVPIGPDDLPIGEVLVEAAVGGTGVTARARMLVSFSEEWVFDNFTEVLSFLRYFGQDRAIRQMRDAPADQRAGLWRDFWDGTDPNPMTPEHEAIDEYFKRLSDANEAFREPGTPGWLTDRGEVVVTLGAPDEIYDSSADVQSLEGLRIIRWNYLAERLTVDFVDDNGFGRFRMTPPSRAEYQRILNRMRRSE